MLISLFLLTETAGIIAKINDLLKIIWFIGLFWTVFHYSHFHTEDFLVGWTQVLTTSSLQPHTQKYPTLLFLSSLQFYSLDIYTKTQIISVKIGKKIRSRKSESGLADPLHK